MNNKATITPVDIYNAIRNDKEIALIFINVSIPQTGKGLVHSDIVSFDSNDDDDEDGDILGLYNLSDDNYQDDYENGSDGSDN